MIKYERAYVELKSELWANQIITTVKGGNMHPAQVDVLQCT